MIATRVFGLGYKFISVNYIVVSSMSTNQCEQQRVCRSYFVVWPWSWVSYECEWVVVWLSTTMRMWLSLYVWYSANRLTKLLVQAIWMQMQTWVCRSIIRRVNWQRKCSWLWMRLQLWIWVRQWECEWGRGAHTNFTIYSFKYDCT